MMLVIVYQFVIDFIPYPFVLLCFSNALYTQLIIEMSIHPLKMVVKVTEFIV